MSRRLDQLLRDLPENRRTRIERRARVGARRIALRELRRIAGLTQTELARRMGVSQPTLSQIESQSDIRLSTLAGMVESLGGTLRIVVDLPQGQFVVAGSRRRRRVG